ncbi:type II toxin-antitoxin system Phd/YefM family antitoxin [Patescibacteria group bacterium]
MATETKKPNIIGVKELRQNLDTYISQVNKGKSFTVVRRSKPVFKISPPVVENEVWETLIDFTEFNKNGISAKDLLSRLKKLNTVNG